MCIMSTFFPLFSSLHFCSLLCCLFDSPWCHVFRTCFAPNRKWYRVKINKRSTVLDCVQFKGYTPKYTYIIDQKCMPESSQSKTENYPKKIRIATVDCKGVCEHIPSPCEWIVYCCCGEMHFFLAHKTQTYVECEKAFFFLHWVWKRSHGFNITYKLHTTPYVIRELNKCAMQYDAHDSDRVIHNSLRWHEIFAFSHISIQSLCTSHLNGNYSTPCIENVTKQTNRKLYRHRRK